MKWRVKKNFEEGLSWGTHLYGYKYENNQYEIIPEEAKVVKKIFDLYLEGNGVQAICKILESDGIKTRNNIFFSKSTIRGMLSNEYYTGDKILQKTYCKDFISKRTLINNGEFTKYYVEDSHEGIISKEDFNKVQEMLKSKIESINWKVKKPLILPFSGMLECGCLVSTIQEKPLHINMFGFVELTTRKELKPAILNKFLKKYYLKCKIKY